jgi:hypothetical protein
LPLTTVSAVYDDLVRARTGVNLSDRVAAAARAYKLAHDHLVQNTRKRKNLKESIEEIEAFKKEVQAARKVKDKVEK